jgi:bifunctional UDP-N-acetylglucosamine pyrophosphorylase/glucosamine-1-phosphate N-acetyltransferase
MQLNPSQHTPAALDVVIMAAGKGTRMKSRTPKVLHQLGGKTLIGHVIEIAQSLGARHKVVVIGHGASEVQAALASVQGLSFALQEPQWGTGHALQTAAPHLPDEGLTLVLSGDVPLIELETLHALLKASEGAHLTLLNLYKDDPHGYGRILRKEPSQGQALGEIQAIVEEKDASDSERQIHEIYSGVMVVPNRLLKPWLKRLQPNNAQKEYYLTDLVKLAHQDGLPIKSHITHDELEVSGINDPEQLAHMERAHQRKIARQLMHAGVRLKDPERIDIRGQLRCESDVQIDVNCVFEGLVVLEQGVRIDAHCVISNAHIKAGAHIKPFTHIEGSPSGADAQGENWASVQVGEGAMVGPFARLRPGAKLSQDVHVGNFVEIKNATLAQGAKANHLAYIGDATVGERVNYGAGSITANYDGANKHHTHIEDDVHVGSNCVLVAPLTLGAEGTIGAGSTITKDTPKGALTVVRAKTLSIESWKRPQKQKK